MQRKTVANALDGNVVIEWAPFVAKEGVSDEELLEASKTIQTEFLEKQEGYIKRELFKGEDKQWVDLVYWESYEAAQKATQGAAQSKACLDYFGRMVDVNHEDPGESVFHYHQMAAWD